MNSQVEKKTTQKKEARTLRVKCDREVRVEN